MARPKTHDEALRQRLLADAAELISTDGVDALSLRKLAKDAGTSTTAVYSLFGGKPGLIHAVYQEAFQRFTRRLADADHGDDPAENVVRLGLAYRENALADPHLYALLFANAARAYLDADDEVGRLADSAFDILVNAVRRAVAAGVFVQEPAELIALGLWGLVHGLVTLEMQGTIPQDVPVDPAYELAVRAGVRGWLRSDRNDTRPGEVAAT